MIIYFPNIFLPCHGISSNLFWVMVFIDAVAATTTNPDLKIGSPKLIYHAAHADVPELFFIFFSEIQNNLHFVTLRIHLAKLVKPFWKIWQWSKTRKVGEKGCLWWIFQRFLHAIRSEKWSVLGCGQYFPGALSFVIWYPYPDCLLVKVLGFSNKEIAFLKYFLLAITT